MATKRPNLLFAIADDASHMSALGHTWVQTPHFDWVAEQGVLFTNAYTTNPKCAPSRASILTGMHTWQLEEAAQPLERLPGEVRTVSGLVGGRRLPGRFHRERAGGPGTGSAICRVTRREPSSTSGLWNRPSTRRSAPPTTPPTSPTSSINRDRDQPFCFWYGGHKPHRRLCA